MELKCRSVLLHIGLFLLFYIDDICSEKTPPVRFDDKPFPTGKIIHKRSVTCSQDHTPGKYPAHTWTCKDMRVDGLRMAYGYNPEVIKDDKCTETNGCDELAEVCRKLMASIEANTRLWAAFVTNATCGYINENRYLLNMTGLNRYNWDEMRPGYGYIDTLRCMAVK